MSSRWLIQLIYAPEVVSIDTRGDGGGLENIVAQGWAIQVLLLVMLFPALPFGPVLFSAIIRSPPAD
jgi:hypothetical protein